MKIAWVSCVHGRICFEVEQSQTPSIQLYRALNGKGV